MQLIACKVRLSAKVVCPLSDTPRGACGPVADDGKRASSAIEVACHGRQAPGRGVRGETAEAGLGGVTDLRVGAASPGLVFGVFRFFFRILFLLAVCSHFYAIFIDFWFAFGSQNL